MEIIAESKFIRTSPRKLRLVARGLKNLKPKEALVVLSHLEKRAGQPLLKALKSALANAKNRQQLSVDSLLLKTIEISGGPIHKRWQPVSRGQAHPIAKRTSHIKVVLEGESPSVK